MQGVLEVVKAIFIPLGCMLPKAGLDSIEREQE